VNAPLRKIFTWKYVKDYFMNIIVQGWYVRKGPIWSKTITPIVVLTFRFFFIFNNFHNNEVDLNVYIKFKRRRVMGANGTTQTTSAYFLTIFLLLL
jgi:hypothetical protein